MSSGEDLIKINKSFRKAILDCNQKAVSALLEKGANIEVLDEEDIELTPLHYAIEHNCEVVACLLVLSGANKESIYTSGDYYEFRPIHSAIRYNQMALFNLLLGKGIDIEAGDGHDETPLVYAARFNRINMVRKLIEKDADINGKGGGAYSPLHVSGNLEVTQLLIDKGADIDMLDSEGETALYLACWGGNIDKASLLIKNGANVNHIDPEGKTPLYAAGLKENKPLVKLLVDSGANVDLAIKEGKTRHPLLRKRLIDSLNDKTRASLKLSGGTRIKRVFKKLNKTKRVTKKY